MCVGHGRSSYLPSDLTCDGFFVVVAGVCLLDTSESIGRKAQQNNYRDISHFASSDDSKKPVSLVCNCPPPRQCCVWMRCSSPC